MTVIIHPPRHAAPPVAPRRRRPSRFGYGLAGLAAAAFTTLAAPAVAQIAVIDPSAIARLREGLQTARQIEQQARANLQSVNQVRSTLGNVGRGNLGAILGTSGLNFTGPQGVLNELVTLSQTPRQLGSLLTHLPNGTATRFNFDSFAGSRQAATQMFFSSAPPQALTDRDVQAVRRSRVALAREAGLNGYGLAIATKADLTRTQATADQLATQARNSTDMRSDIQVNTAALLALYTETAKQTAIQAQLLELEAARHLAGDESSSAPR